MAGSDSRTATAWDRVESHRLDPPVVVRAPYVEVKLEHPGVEPTAFGDSFFPDAVPYRLDDEKRTFFWRDASVDGGREAPVGLCATTRGLVPMSTAGRRIPVVRPRPDGSDEVVVDGTVAGDSTTAVVASYDPPAIRIRRLDRESVAVETPSGVMTVAAGDRDSTDLPAQTVTVTTADESPATDGATTADESVTPRLTVRYPGVETVYRPAPDAAYALFPSFGVNLAAFPTPVEVPTVTGELDDDSLAATLGVALAERPYPERVLWRAFAYSAFDPHRSDAPRLAQFPSGLLAVTNPQAYVTARTRR